MKNSDENTTKFKTNNRSNRNNLKGVKSFTPKTSSTKKELAQSVTKLGKLKGEKKEAYIGELISRNDSIAFASDLLNFMNNVISYTGKLDQSVIQGYQSTINRLLDRIDQLDENKNPKELEQIYHLIGDLSNKIYQVNRDGKVILLAFLSIAALAIKPILVHRKLK